MRGVRHAMTASKSLTFYFLLIGIGQIVVGALALVWAWPLFADPPFLGNGLTREYSQVRSALLDNPSFSEPLSELRSKLQWLFARHSEGVLVAMLLGAISVALGFVSVLLGFRSKAALRKVRGAHA
jgi:type IV secretory pathway TraG/TraD family ATPase VirD4